MKKVIPIILSMLLLVVFIFAAGPAGKGGIRGVQFGPLNPADGATIIDFTSGRIDLFVNVNSSNASLDIANVSLYMNWNGTIYRSSIENKSWWFLNETKTNGTGNFTENLTNYNFNITSIADNSQIYYGFEACTSPDMACVTTSANRSLTVQYPPIVNYSLTNPADSIWSSASTVDIGFHAYTDYMDSGNAFTCWLWTNESGSWLQDSEYTKTAANESNASIQTNMTVDFSEKVGTLYAVKCAEAYNLDVYNFTVNRTINIDRTAPVLTVNTPADALTNNSLSITYNINLTDTNTYACYLYENATGTWTANASNTSITTGIPWTPTLVFGLDQVSTQVNDPTNETFEWGVICNDSAGTQASIANRTLTIDMFAPNITYVGNYSIRGSCDSINISWITGENTNGSIAYGNSATHKKVIAPSTRTLSRNHSAILGFGVNHSTSYYFNVTSCDPSGNCNSSANLQVRTPVSVCTGWTAFAILEHKMNLSEIAIQSNADYVYKYNSTGQSWNYWYPDGATGDSGLNISYGYAAWLYEADNETWYRNETWTSARYNSSNPPLNDFFNLTKNNNFLGLVKTWNFVNFTNTFNQTNYGGDAIGEGNWTMNYTAWYNNTAQSYNNFIFNWTWHNETMIPRGEVVWISLKGNYSYNGTAINGSWIG